MVILFFIILIICIISSVLYYKIILLTFQYPLELLGSGIGRFLLGVSSSDHLIETPRSPLHIDAIWYILKSRLSSISIGLFIVFRSLLLEIRIYKLPFISFRVVLNRISLHAAVLLDFGIIYLFNHAISSSPFAALT